LQLEKKCLKNIRRTLEGKTTLRIYGLNWEDVTEAELKQYGALV